MRAILCCLLLLSAVAAPAADYVFAEGEVVFTSEATLESFQGRTDVLSAELSFDPGDLTDSLALRVEVDLASLDTGIGLRNTHMRENHLHTEEHPKAVFTGRRLMDPPTGGLAPGEERRLEVAGVLDLHGVARERVLPVRVLLRRDGLLEVHSDFTISLEAHRIPRPKFLIMKVADEQKLALDVVLRPKGEQR